MSDENKNNMVRSVLALKTLLNLEKLVAGISHEMKSPMVAIRGIVGLMRSNCVNGKIGDVDDLTECIDMLDKSIESLSFTLNALVSIKTATKNNAIDNINVVDVIIQSFNMARLSDINKRASSKIDFIIQCNHEECAYSDTDNLCDVIEILHCYNEGCPFMIQTSPYVLQTAIISLVENSIHALEDMRIENKYIKAIVYKAGDKSGIDIIDNGEGVNETLKKKLFKPFTSGHMPPGTGLGLFMSKIMIESIGGEIFLKHSEPGNTIFSITMNKNNNKF